MNVSRSNEGGIRGYPHSIITNNNIGYGTITYGTLGFGS